MKKLLLVSLLGLPVALFGVPAMTAPAVAQAAYGWRLVGKYRTPEEAYRMAAKLKARGYKTDVKKQGGFYCVLCKC